MTVTATALDDGIEAARALGAVYRTITGRVVPYDAPADVGYFSEEFRRGAFTASLAEHAAVPLLFAHNRTSLPIGVADAWDDRADGLYGRFRLALTPVAQSAGAHAAEGLMTGLSVGFSARQTSWRYVSPERWDPDNGVIDHAVRTAARLHEVSLVATPAYVGARVVAVDAETFDAGTERSLRLLRQLEPDTVASVPTATSPAQDTSSDDRLTALEAEVARLYDLVQSVWGLPYAGIVDLDQVTGEANTGP
jgi:HK97 family phage prohead protease